MITWIKAHKNILVVLSFAYLYVILMLVFPRSYQAITPGEITKVEQVITIDGIQMNDDFYTVSVISFRPITPFQSMIIELDKKSITRPLSLRQRDTTLIEAYRQGQITKEVSYHMAVIQAYEMAKQIDDTIEIAYQYDGLIVYYRPSHFSVLDIGDIIVAINGQSADDHTHTSFLNLAYETVVTLSVLYQDSQGNDQIKEVTYIYQDSDQRMLFYPKYTITQAYPTYQFPGLDAITGGPSGGLMQTLSIYASLVNINTGDLKIVGTGTIEFGGIIGPVGGVAQKIYAAQREKADMFFMPKSLQNQIPNDDFDFDIILVETLEEAIDELHQRIG
ncbi:MAG: S16 family serine protease [Acholeplasmataceae bacterium]